MRNNSTSEDRFKGVDPFTQFANPERIVGLVSPEHVECHCKSNPVPPNCESGKLTTTLPRPIELMSCVFNGC